MPLSPGEYRIGPPEGRIRLHTYRQGVAARVGHDLTLEATDWSGRVLVPDPGGEPPLIDAEIDMRELAVIEGRGGIKPLSASDKQEIHKSMQKSLFTSRYPKATFRSQKVERNGDSAVIEGTFSLVGQDRMFRLQAERDGDRVRASGQVIQTNWGIKPYTGLLGALKLADRVDVEVTLMLPVSGP